MQYTSTFTTAATGGIAPIVTMGGGKFQHFPKILFLSNKYLTEQNVLFLAIIFYNQFFFSRKSALLFWADDWIVNFSATSNSYNAAQTYNI